MSDAEPGFHPLYAYTMDELFEALDRRCFGVFVSALPRKTVGEGTTTNKFIRWHDFKGLELLGAVRLAERVLMNEIESVQTPEDDAPDDK